MNADDIFGMTDEEFRRNLNWNTTSEFAKAYAEALDITLGKPAH